MTLRTRRKIFYTLVALFIVIGGGVALYAQGWRLVFASWDKAHFEKIGGIYIRSYPQDVAIYLNGKSIQNQSGFLSPGTLVSNLLPRSYRLELQSTGYHEWEENAAVEPALVTPFKYAVLVPEHSSPGASSTIRLLATQTAATTTDPYNANQKILLGRNKVSLFDIAAATTTQSVTTPGRPSSTMWIAPNLVAMLQADGELFIYDTGSGNLRKLADTVTSFTASNDGSMVAALEKNGIEVFSLSDASIYYRFVLPDPGGARRLIWYRDLNHLFVVYTDHVAFLDFTDTGLVNFITVARGTVPLYDRNSNVFYVRNASGTYEAYTFAS